MLEFIQIIIKHTINQHRIVFDIISSGINFLMKFSDIFCLLLHLQSIKLFIFFITKTPHDTQSFYCSELTNFTE